MGSWVVTQAANLCYGVELTDQCTCYKVLDGDLARSLNLKTQGFEVCSEITAKVLRLNHTILELPIAYEGRTIDAGKKIRAWDTVRLIGCLVRLRFGAIDVHEKGPAIDRSSSKP